MYVGSGAAVVVLATAPEESPKSVSACAFAGTGRAASPAIANGKSTSLPNFMSIPPRLVGQSMSSDRGYCSSCGERASSMVTLARNLNVLGSSRLKLIETSTKPGLFARLPLSSEPCEWQYLTLCIGKLVRIDRPLNRSLWQLLAGLLRCANAAKRLASIGLGGASRRERNRAGYRDRVVWFHRAKGAPPRTQSHS